MNYFYIITRDKNIMEVAYDAQTYQSVLNSWSQNKRIIINPKGQSPQGVNSADISHIFPVDGYENWLDAAQPKRYIKSGTWFSGKGEFIRHENWRQIEIDQKLKLEAPKVNEKGIPIPAEMRKEISKLLK